MSRSMSDPVRRALRTFFQGFLGSVISSGILSSVAVDGVVDASVAQKGLVSALAAGSIALVSYIHNALEDAGRIRDTR